jgi:hypothetical protein
MAVEKYNKVLKMTEHISNPMIKDNSSIYFPNAVILLI